MKAYQKEFIEFALAKQVLRFGEFTLKSGRTSPYFFNAGLFNTGGDLARLGRFYATALVDSNIEFDLLFGPAYKGIPIATTTAVALADHHDIDMPYCFNRKEVKKHGEGGSLVGSELAGKVMLVDDVITAGTAIRESMEIIKYPFILQCNFKNQSFIRIQMFSFRSIKQSSFITKISFCKI